MKKYLIISILVIGALFLFANAARADTTGSYCGESHGTYSGWAWDWNTYSYDIWTGYSGSNITCSPTQWCNWTWDHYSSNYDTSYWACSCQASSSCQLATLTFSASPSGSQQTNGANVTYTATSSVDVGPTIYYIRIYEGSTQRASCGNGTQCAYTTSGSNTTRTFTAKIETFDGGTQAVTPQSISTMWFSLDTTPPTSSIISPAAGSSQSTNFLVSVSDSDTGGSGLATCYYHVYDSGAGWTESWHARTCNWSFGVTVGSTGDCRTSGGTCTVYAFAKDGAGNTGNSDIRSFGIAPTLPSLTYPTNRWQRLWFTDPKNNNFSNASFLGETPDEPNEQFITDWGSGVLAYGKSDQVGFKSSTAIDFTNKGGNYVFTVGSDDGVRLSIDGNVVINQWSDGSYRTSSATVDMVAVSHTFLLEYYENTGNAKVSFAYALAPCAKSSNLLTNDLTIIIPSGSATGGSKACQIRITHFGGDQTDGLPVGYEILNAGLGFTHIGMSDDTSTCNNNLKWSTSWGAPFNSSYNFWAYSSKDDYNAAHTLYYGYEINTNTPYGRTCVVKDFTCPSAWNLSFCPPPVTTDRSFAASINWPNTATQSSFGAALNLVECTNDSQCTPGSSSANSDATDSTKTYCNYGTTHNAGVSAHDTSNFPQNTCIDSVAPTITLGTIKRTSDGVSLGTVGNGQWLKAGIYEISITPQDNIGGSGIDTSYRPVTIRSKGADNVWGINPATGISDDKVYSTTRTSTNTFSVWVGPSSDSLNDCVDQDLDAGEGRCRVEIFARDLAGNQAPTQIIPLKIDFTPPTAQ